MRIEIEAARASSIRVFPHVLFRIAGGAFEELRQLDLTRTFEAIRALEVAREESAAATQELCDALFARIGASEPGPERAALVAAKRAAFNRRPVANAERYTNALADERVKALVLESTFAAEVAEKREALRALASSETLQRGLALASRNLLQSVNEFYLQRTTLNGKDLDTEQGALRYIARMYAKTSPFSTFTSIAATTLDSPLSALRPPLSNVRINNLVWAHLRTRLLRDRELRRHIPLRANPTIRRGGDAWRFLVNSGNVEAFQRLESTPAIETVLELCARPLAWATLVSALDADEAEAYVEALVRYGFLEPAIPVSGSDPDWDEALARFLEPIPGADAWLSMLAELRSLARAFESAPPSDRAAILARAETVLQPSPLESRTLSPASAGLRARLSREDDDEKAFERLDDRAYARLPEILFFEDTIVDAPPLAATDAHRAIATLDDLLDSIAPFEIYLDEREEMKAYFDRLGEARVPLLDFYESYARDALIPAAQREKLRERVAPGDPFATRSGVAAERHQRTLAALARWSDSANVDRENVQLTRNDLAELRFDGAPRPRTNTSYSALLQFFRGGAVFNGLFAGFGKMSCRFLHLAAPEFTRDLQEWNAALANGALLAEATDQSFSNANLHPPLLPWEIATPHGNHAAPPERQLAVSDIDVVSTDHELALVHRPSGRRIYAFDLGIQAWQQRSQLFQLLSRFTLATSYAVQPLLDAVNRVALRGSAPGLRSDVHIVVRPRVTYGEGLVLQRRTWVVRKEAIPMRDKHESECAYFCRVDAWRRAHGIPDEVFLYLYPSRDYMLRAVTNGHRDQLRKDDRKPQFIAFRNPFLVTLFGRLVPRGLAAIQLVEMLPAAEELLDVGGERRVTECVVQWGPS